MLRPLEVGLYHGVQNNPFNFLSTFVMYVLSLTVFCVFVVLGSTREQLYHTECCENIRGLRECKRECEKVWTERKSGKKLELTELTLSLPKVCPSHLVSLWKCLNQSIKGLHLYSHSNLLKGEGKSCCLLGIESSCRKACFLSASREELKKSCKAESEDSLLRCIERSDASSKCCQTRYRRCERACQIVFASNKEPSKKKLRNVKRNCKRENKNVYQCVSRVKLPKERDHKCCRITENKKCRAVCREVMATNTWEEKTSKLRETCSKDSTNYLAMFTCFLNHAKSMKNTGGGSQRDVRVDVRLHCCLSAQTEECFKLCLRTYAEDSETGDLFKKRCEFNPQESTMFTCIADVSQPCHIGCSGLGFCKHFNHRHTELFRSCTKEKDNAAKSDYENWLKKKRVEIHSLDVVPVKDIATCLPEMWKAVACTLQIRPCHAKSHGSTICRKDCLKLLGECAEKEKLGVKTVEKICDGLSPDDQSSCISMESYLKPSSYQNETTEVTHPCYPNPCPSNDVCDVNRASPENAAKDFVSYKCTPGCPIDHQSKTVIKNGHFARLPIVQNSKLEGCFKICRCENGKLSVCPRLPSCVKRNSCYYKATNKTYEHQEKFLINCNFCVCFDGKVLCSRTKCLPGAANATERLRRNHVPNHDKYIGDLSCQCVGKYEPVCGANGKTYRSVCFARCAGLSIKQVVKGQCSSINPCHSSPCPENKLCVVDRKVCVGSISSCPQFSCVESPMNCTNSSSQLLCDTKNKQHLSQCEVQKNEKEVAYSGKCKPSCGPGKKVVCGVDGQTYGSMCALNYAHMLLDYEGPCKTVGKYGNEDPTVRCAYITCPQLNPPNCDGVTPPGACCEVCATQLTVLFDETEVSNTNKIVMDNQAITQEQVVARVRRHISMSQCDVFGFYNTENDFILLVRAITEKPTTLQFLICIKEAQKIETLINTQSAIFTSDEILSSFRAVSLSTPKLSQVEVKGEAVCSSHSSLPLLFICTLLTITLSWTR
ncbi:reversion-inducing cysteine-rich protein with Kazal motifs-like [Dendronephthya gigantea]|uniref:reversion-inducing cysteine-rich protein with Kazal motifs-like n=1 Tax=Dendronephthya gigantea TaxID=151771 RepID=UPI00106B46DD|nr:reversion-inducing cysteine-rich protein with Kazal motifs-like [Dendronephthya gigantea]